MIDAALLFTLTAACTAENPIGGGSCPPGAPAPSVRPPSSGRNRVAYVTTVNERARAYMLDLDAPAADPVRLDAVGTAEGPLSPQWGAGRLLVWSPAGGQIAVRTGPGIGSPAALGVIDVANPGTVRDLGLPEASPLGFDDHEATPWSPDGTRLTTADYIDRSAWVVNADGSNKVRVASGIGQIGGSTWSPDGTYVGIDAWGADEKTHLYVTPADREEPLDVATDLYMWGAAGTQLLGYREPGEWNVFDLAADVREVVTVPQGHAPVFSGDGGWLFASGPPRNTVRARGCGDPIELPGSYAWEPKATVDGNHIAFSDELGTGDDGAKLWVADRAGDTWTVRHLYTPTTPERRADWPVASTTGSRLAWLLGGNATDRFLVTHDGVRDAVKVPVPGIVPSVIMGTYFFSPDLRRLAYLAGTVETATLRVLDIADPSNPVMLGEIVPPVASAVYWVSWSPDGSAFGYATVDRTSPMRPIPSDLYTTRIRNGALETPRLLGPTQNFYTATFHWEP